jgi:hypothetical protein
MESVVRAVSAPGLAKIVQPALSAVAATAMTASRSVRVAMLHRVRIASADVRAVGPPLVMNACRELVMSYCARSACVRALRVKKTSLATRSIPIFSTAPGVYRWALCATPHRSRDAGRVSAVVDARRDGRGESQSHSRTSCPRRCCSAGAYGEAAVRPGVALGAQRIIAVGRSKDRWMR